jgi:hypothetical protein
MTILPLFLFGLQVLAIPLSIDQVIGIIDYPEQNEIHALRSVQNCVSDATGIIISHYREGHPLLSLEVFSF